jgi:hypothetical protein
VDALAEKAREKGVRDPDGNVIEISHDQKVFETVRRLWVPGHNETSA